jgi:hypothetical protein
MLGTVGITAVPESKGLRTVTLWTVEYLLDGVRKTKDAHVKERGQNARN